MAKSRFSCLFRVLQRTNDRRSTFVRRVRLEHLEERIVFDTYLVSNLSNSGTGSLRAAVEAANFRHGADSIQFKSNLSGTIVLQSELSVTGDTEIIGNSNRKVTISGDDVTRVLRIAPGTEVELKNLVITKGKATDADGGGGILNFGNLEIERSIVTGNRALHSVVAGTLGGGGGGIHSLGKLQMEETSVTNNFASVFGGGILNEGQAVIEESSIDKNEAGEIRTNIGTIRGEGGGIMSGISFFTAASSPTSLRLENSTVNENTAGGDAAGIFSGQGTNLTLDRSVVSGNAATRFGTGGIAIAGNASLLDSKITKNTGAASGIYIFREFNPIPSVETIRIVRTEISQNTGNKFNDSRVGGIWDESRATIRIEDSSIKDNKSARVGGIKVGFSSMEIQRSTISGNQGTEAGGISNIFGHVKIDSSTISGNTGISTGGIYFNGANGGTMEINASTISSNKATPDYFYGAGGLMGNMKVVNSTISGNTVDAKNVRLDPPYLFLTPHVAGGWLADPSFPAYPTASAESSTIAFNSAVNVDSKVQSAGGVLGFGFYSEYVDPPADVNANVQIRNTIIARNQVNGKQNDVFGTFESRGTNLIGVLTSDATGFVPSDLRGTATNPLDPRLAPLAWNGGRTLTHRLNLFSPAINAGNNTDAPATDQRGFKRVALGRIDIGSYEWLSIPVLFGAAIGSVNEELTHASQEVMPSIETSLAFDISASLGANSEHYKAKPSWTGGTQVLSLKHSPTLQNGLSRTLNFRLADHIFKDDVSNLIE